MTTEVGPMLKRYSSPDDSHVTRTRDVNPEPEAELRTSRQELFKHIARVHIAFPRIMIIAGVQYDAELASFLGYNLDPTAETLTTIMERVSNGKPWQTPLRQLRHLCHDSREERRFLTEGEGRQYIGVVAHELSRLVDLGVSAVDPDSLAVWQTLALPPITDDPFNHEFQVEGGVSSSI